jgi:hypothetical protein
MSWPLVLARGTQTVLFPKLAQVAECALVHSPDGTKGAAWQPDRLPDDGLCWSVVMPLAVGFAPSNHVKPERPEPFKRKREAVAGLLEK